MANMHSNFQRFNEALTIKGNRKKKLISSRKAVEQAIIKHFKAHKNLPVPKFWIQGSYSTGTIILKKDKTYDVDLGVYFFDKSDLQPKALQQNVQRAIKDQTEAGTQHKDKCIRVIYKGEFNIDLPIYFFRAGTNPPYLATKSGWFESDPKKLKDWFATKKDKNGQLVRIVKYLKSWADARSRKMPSGVALTVWAAKHYVSSSRDDIALVKTAKAIENSLSWGTSCKCPAPPKDDLVARLDDNQKVNFRKAFRQLIKDGEQAIKEPKSEKALNIWVKQLGNRFS